MKVGELFAGIGGIGLGLERAGCEVAWQVENDPYCRRVLAKHWPDVPRWGDIREVNPDDLPRVDLVTAGFPCQPVSLAGLGRAQQDERWLWPEAARLVRGLRPRWVLLENVSGLLARGMGDVLGELAASGYDAEWDCIPASAVGAPHQRDRVWVVAYPNADRGGFAWRAEPDLGPQQPGQPASQRDHADRLRVAVPDAERVELRHEPGRRHGQDRAGAPVAGDDGTARLVADTDGKVRRVAAPVFADARLPSLPRSGQAGPRRRDGADNPWAIEPDVGRVAHGIPARLDRLRSLGNAVVPQVAEHIGRLILAADVATQDEGAA